MRINLEAKCSWPILRYQQGMLAVIAETYGNSSQRRKPPVEN
jgi:hypothetical protein